MYRKFARKAYINEVHQITISFNKGKIMTTKTKRQQVTFKIPKETNDRLAALAVATRRTKTFVLEEAVSAYLDYNEWQIQSIQKGLEDMKAGRVTDHETVVKEWEQRVADSLD